MVAATDGPFEVDAVEAAAAGDEVAQAAAEDVARQPRIAAVKLVRRVVESMQVLGAIDKVKARDHSRNASYMVPPGGSDEPADVP